MIHHETPTDESPPGSFRLPAAVTPYRDFAMTFDGNGERIPFLPVRM